MPRPVQGVERQLVACVADGKVFDGATVQSGAPRDPANQLLQVPAAFLADILLSRVSGLVADPRGVHLTNCVITGELDLTRAAMQAEQVERAVLPLTCSRVVFEREVRLDYASTGAISLTECRLPGLRARGADIATDLTLDDCWFFAPDPFDSRAYRLIDLDGATIGGDFSAKRLRYAVGLQDLIKQAPLASGPLAFAKILIDADNTKVSGGVDLSCVLSRGEDEIVGVPFATLMGNFDNAEIFGDFRALGARFAPTSTGAHSAGSIWSNRQRKCLDLRGAQVRGDVELDYIQTAGEIHLEDATLTQDLSLGGARLVNVNRDSGWSGSVLEGMGLAVGGSIHFVDRRGLRTAVGTQAWTGAPGPDFAGAARSRSLKKVWDGRLLAIGHIRLTRARIGGDLDASGATICAVGLPSEGVALDMRSTEVGGTLFLDGRRDVGPGLFIGLVNLINIKVSGSVILSGSWFRAPAGQQMGPQRIHLPVVQNAPDNREPAGALADHGSDRLREDWSDVDRLQVARTDRELNDWGRNQLWRTCRSAVRQASGEPESPVILADREHWSEKPPARRMLTVLENLGIRVPLELSRRELWRLRGGCRAIAMVDAQVTGSVLFGIGPTAWGPDSQDVRPPETDPGYDGPSVVVGCVDLDRIRIDGNLRLTGGVFRAVTPVIPDAACLTKANDGDDATHDSGSAKDNAIASGGTAGNRGIEEDIADTGPPDVSLSAPSTPGWTELKARVCLSLQSANIKGRFESKYFGPIPIRRDHRQNTPPRPILRQIDFEPGSDALRARLAEHREALRIVPEFPELNAFLGHLRRPGSADRTGCDGAAFNAPACYVDEMLTFLDLAFCAEWTDDRSLGATLPALPRVHNFAGSHQDAGRWYPLRPDGLFDLSGAAIQSIHDHPCHGWPTSDGHLELNGCTYNYLTLSHLSSHKFPVNQDERAETGATDDPSDAGGTGALTSTYPPPGGGPAPDGPTERHGTSMGWRLRIWCEWRLRIGWHLVLYAFMATPYYVCRAASWSGLHGRGKPRCAAIFSECSEQYFRLYTVRYIEYAVASFRIRNDNSASPEARRIKWLEQQYPGAGPGKHDFRPQPYEQLAGVMRATGYSLDADQIAAAKRSMRWRAGVFGLVQRGFDIFLWLTCKYTYSPTRIFLWLVALTVITGLISGAAHDRGMLQPNDGSGDFSPWLYASDTIIPIVEFGYVDDWSVRSSSQMQCFGWGDWVAAMRECDGPPDRAFDQSHWIGKVKAGLGEKLLDAFNIDRGRRLEWAFGLMTGFGSLFTALAVITFTGVMRRD